MTNRAETIETLVDKVAEYVENNPIEIHLDYSNDLDKSDITRLLNDGSDVLGDIISEIEYSYVQYLDGSDYSYYFDQVSETLEIDRDQIETMLDDGDVNYPYCQVMNPDALISNTDCHLQAILGDSIEVSKSLEGFYELIPAEYVDVSKLDETEYVNTGQITFLLNDLEGVLQVLESDCQTVTFKSGTWIFVHNYFEGSGEIETQLVKDLTVPKTAVSFYNDDDDSYGINSTYGLVETCWEGQITC
jgi:hypothetical protein